MNKTFNILEKNAFVEKNEIENKVGEGLFSFFRY